MAWYNILLNMWPILLVAGFIGAIIAGIFFVWQAKEKEWF